MQNNFVGSVFMGTIKWELFIGLDRNYNTATFGEGVIDGNQLVVIKNSFQKVIHGSSLMLLICAFYETMFVGTN
jgi:hypothetical protein